MKEVELREWKFLREEHASDSLPYDRLTSITVPHTWNGSDGQDGGNDYDRGIATYVTTFECSNLGMRYGLRFEGANVAATVYVNGHRVGYHVGGYSAFYVAIPKAILQPLNEVVVHVDNTRRTEWIPFDADFTMYGGLYRPVHLIIQNELAFDYTHWGTRGVEWHQLEATSERALIRADIYLTEISAPHDVQIDIAVYDDKTCKVTSEITFRHHSARRIQCPLLIRNPHRWHGMSDPFQYRIVISLRMDHQLIESHVTMLGVRDLKMTEQGLLLNDQPILLNGVCRHQDREAIGNALLTIHHEEDLHMIREIGANAIRLAHYQQADYVYQRCDELGFIVWAEIPYITQPIDGDTTGDEPARQLQELIRQNRHHVSIAFWGIQNEITLRKKRPEVIPILQRLARIGHHLDQSRLLTQAQVGGLPLDDELNQITEVIAYNHYFGWYYGEVGQLETWLDEHHRLFPHRPIGMSEYGVDALEFYHSDHPQSKDYTEEYQSWWHEQTYRILHSRPFVWGTFIWNMFNFGSDLRNEGGVKGRNNKGLVTFDRKLRKDAFYYYQANWVSTPVLHLCSQRFVHRHLADTFVKVYSNLSQLELYHNQQRVGLMTRDGVVWTHPIQLVPGVNHIEVRSPTLTDHATWILSDTPDTSYLPPSGSRKTTIWV